MIIQLEQKIKDNDKKAIVEKVNGLKYKTTEVTTRRKLLIGIGKTDFDIREVGFMPGNIRYPYRFWRL